MLHARVPGEVKRQSTATTPIWQSWTNSSPWWSATSRFGGAFQGCYYLYATSTGTIHDRDLAGREGAMRIYRGDRTIDGIKVTVDGALLDPCCSIRTFSPNGFEWSYEGAEPAQLAFAMLADHWGDTERALRHHDVFMRVVVANFDNEWEMTSADIDAALANISSG
jgi:hypothetical protein